MIRFLAIALLCCGCVSERPMKPYDWQSEVDALSEHAIQMKQEMRQ